MSKSKDIYEKIGLTIDEANDCWGHDCVNEFDLDEFIDPAEVLIEIISDEEIKRGEK